MKTIKLSDTLALPLMEFATQATGVLGTKGAGKSYNAGVLCEHLMQCDIPLTVIDPSGVWRYLKVPGTGKGFPVVVVGGGDQQDLPLDANTIEDITRAAMKSGVSLVIDLFTSRPSKETIRQVVLKCVTTMFYENEAQRMVVIEEAAEVVPQRVMAEHARVYAAIDQLVRVGGNRSLGVMLINQRAEDINKSVLELCDFMFLHRQRGRNSLKNLQDWFGKTNMEQAAIDEVIATTMRLEAGECWYLSKDADQPIRLRMPKKQSFHPDRQKPELTTSAVKRVVDVGDWVKKLREALPKPDEEKKPDKVAAAAAKVEPKVVEKEVIKEILVPVLSDDDRTGLIKTSMLLREMNEKIDAVLKQIDQFQKPLPKPVITPKTGLRPTPPSPTAQPVGTGGDADVKIEAGLRRMLTALAQCPGGLNDRQLGIRAGMSSKAGGFGNYLGKARSNGWIDGEREHLMITDSGRKILGEVEPLPTGKALFEYWRSSPKLPAGAKRILEALYVAYPDALTDAQVGEVAGMEHTAGGFGNYLGKLRTLGLVHGKRDFLRASDEFF